jgi:acyl-CoA synthetase (AMP-forming)/AMP-acid ligase II
MLLEMAASENPERLAVVSDDIRWSTKTLDRRSDRGAGVIRRTQVKQVAYIGTGGVLLPLLLFASARAGTSFCPLNYRLSAETLRAQLARLADPLIVVDREYQSVIDASRGPTVITSDEFLASVEPAEPFTVDVDPEDTAVILFTSGTTALPKAVELSHANLLSYIMGTVEFASAAMEDAALVCVPPYHIAGVGAALSNVYAGRRVVYLRDFDAPGWIRLAAKENITTATVVPTMLDRIVSALEKEPIVLPSLRNLAYGGSKVSLPLVRKALAVLPDVGFVNAYGLTETSSTIAVLTPEDHREAMTTADPVCARRLGSVGRPVPSVEIQIRADDGSVLGCGATGELFVRGPQISGRYAGLGSVLDAEGWFPTKDLAATDCDGYLFILGRADDTIIRGGENIAPAELEDVLVEHPAVHQVAVVGVDDGEWGQIIVAAVVPLPGANPRDEELRDWVRARLRGSRTPDRVVFVDELPTTPTGKVVRRELKRMVQASTAEPA